MDFTDGHTPYDILELSNGPQATEADIRKAYKALALKKHPDKNKGKSNAAAEFAELEKAYRVLTDASARGALDDYLSAKAQRKQRQSNESDKRRKMREDLERREKEANSGRSEEHIARARLLQELERLRKKAEDEQRAAAQAQAQAVAAAAAAASGPAGGAAGEPSDETKAQLRCSLKVSWDPNTRDYSSQELRSIFAAHGLVADVVVRERKARGSTGRSKASALVVMSSWQEADRAAGAVNGDASDPLLVVPLLKVAPSLASGDGILHPAPQASTASGHTAANTAKPLSQGPGEPAFPVLHRTGPSAADGIPAATLFPSGANTQQPPQTAAGTGPGQPLFAAGAGAQGSGYASSFPSSKGPTTGGFGSFPGFGGVGGTGGGMGRAEDAILLKMRRAAERERQLAAAKADDPDS